MNQNGNSGGGEMRSAYILVCKNKAKRLAEGIRWRYEQSKMTIKFPALQIRKMGTAIYVYGKSNFMRSGVWGLPIGNVELNSRLCEAGVQVSN